MIGTDAKCKDKVSPALTSRLSDIRKLWKADQEGNEERHVEEMGTFSEYGLCFDYIPAGTFANQEKGYFRYQLSCGGPTEEFRFFIDIDKDVYNIEFWYLDWFDGAYKILYGGRRDLMEEIFNFFRETGSVDAEYKAATAI